MREQAARDDAKAKEWEAYLQERITEAREQRGDTDEWGDRWEQQRERYPLFVRTFDAAWAACEARVLRVLEAEATRYEHSSIKSEMIGRSDLQSEHGYAEDIIRRAVQAVRAAGEGTDGV